PGGSTLPEHHADGTKLEALGQAAIGRCFEGQAVVAARYAARNRDLVARQEQLIRTDIERTTSRILPLGEPLLAGIEQRDGGPKGPGRTRPQGHDLQWFAGVDFVGRDEGDRAR